MALMTLVALLAVLEYIVFGMLVGMARGKYGVLAPATSGNEVFERYYRVQQNTLEQLVIFIPGLWAFGQFLSSDWAAAIGLVYILGRVVYARAYITDPPSRGVGMIISVLPSYILVLGGLGGAAWSLVAQW